MSLRETNSALRGGHDYLTIMTRKEADAQQK